MIIIEILAGLGGFVLLIFFLLLVINNIKLFFLWSDLRDKFDEIDNRLDVIERKLKVKK